ncbi:MAG TPA: ABC transporter substrate-binding protein, partial [Gemmatimonadaceae bacterium]
TTLHEIPFDSADASRKLDALGWRMDKASGVRRRAGQQLAFSLLVPSSSKIRTGLAVLLQAQFARVGAKVSIDAAEPAVFVDRLQKGDFDAAIHAWHSDPSPAALRELWGTQVPGTGANYASYSNPSVDALVDSAAAEFHPERRTALFNRAYQTIVDDAPAVWLYEPRNVAGIQRRVTPVGMRADAWWADIADWKPAAKR